MTVPPERLANWADSFSSYRSNPKQADILAWLAQFSEEHRELACKILDHVIVVSETQALQGLRTALQNTPGWHRAAGSRNGKWYFAGFGGPGESGATMLHKFREANDMTSSRWQTYFVSLRDLPGKRLTAADTVIFVDDFSGSGRQVCSYWPRFQELVASEARCVLILLAATATALDRISDETELEPVVHITIAPSESVFAEGGNFSPEDQNVLVEYGKRAWSKHPKGFGECGLLFVLSHKTPNNSLPILYARNDTWIGLFPRSILPPLT